MILEHKTLKINDKVIFEKLVLDSNFKRMPKHFVANEACFMFLSKGAFLMRTPNNLIKFTEGEAMLAKCGNYFFEELILSNNQGENKIIAISAYFYPEIIKHIFTIDLDLQKINNSFDVNNISAEPLLKSFSDSVDFLLNNPSIADDNLILLKLKELILLISRTNQVDKLNDFIQSLFSKTEYDFKNVIESNLYANMKLEELAFLLNMSVATFKRKFKAIYNESTNRYFQQKKILKAQQLLRSTTISIADVCYGTGFENLTNFNRVFKKITNLNPTEYRLSQNVKLLS